jgi:hypothetical protein
MRYFDRFSEMRFMARDLGISGNLKLATGFRPIFSLGPSVTISLERVVANMFESTEVPRTFRERLKYVVTNSSTDIILPYDNVVKGIDEIMNLREAVLHLHFNRILDASKFDYYENMENLYGSLVLKLNTVLRHVLVQAAFMHAGDEYKESKIAYQMSMQFLWYENWDPNYGSVLQVSRVKNLEMALGVGFSLMNEMMCLTNINTAHARNLNPNMANAFLEGGSVVAFSEYLIQVYCPYKIKKRFNFKRELKNTLEHLGLDIASEDVDHVCRFRKIYAHADFESYRHSGAFETLAEFFYHYWWPLLEASWKILIEKIAPSLVYFTIRQHRSWKISADEGRRWIRSWNGQLNFEKDIEKKLFANIFFKRHHGLLKHMR